MTDEPTTAPPDSPAPRPGPPPLRIHHILVATAATAALLALGRTTFPSSGLAILYFVSGGLTFTLIGFGIAWRRAGRSFFQHPGHWLLLISAVSFVNTLVMRFNWSVWRSSGQWYSLFVTCSSVLQFTWLTIDLVAAWKGFGSRWWRWFFLSMGGFKIAPFVFGQWVVQYRSAYEIAYQYSVLVVLAAAAASDVRTARERDWVHWVGVALTAITFVYGAAICIWPDLLFWPGHNMAGI